MGHSPQISSKLFWRHKNKHQVAVRDGDWKYLSINGQEHLCNIAKDERERAERKDVEVEVFQRLGAVWEAWNATMLPLSAEQLRHCRARFSRSIWHGRHRIRMTRISQRSRIARGCVPPA